MKNDFFKLIKSCDLFSSLDDETLLQWVDKFKVIHLKKSKVLFHQGSFSNSLYVVVSGKLSVILHRDHKETKVLNIIGAGETIGEMGALSNEPRTTTVKALEHCVLLKLSSIEFNDLINQNPVVMQKTLIYLMQRSRSLIQMVSNDEFVQKNIVIIAANQTTSLAQFHEKIFPLVSNMSRVALLSDYSSDIGTVDETRLKQIIAEKNEKNDSLLYLLKSPKTVIGKFAFQEADVIYIVSNYDSESYIDISVAREIKNNKSYPHNKIELILLHENENIRPLDTSRWLDLMKFNLNHHIRIHQGKDWQRILRFMCGKAVGLVLGGGGLRCWAHLGAIRALEKAGIPIDIVGGTSAGAIVAGHYGLHETNKDSIKGLQELSEATRRAVSLTNLTWPAVSIFNSKDYTRKLYELFGSHHIEDLWLPCFCITTNLSNFSQMVYRRGRLWKTIRTSSSVPGIFPPVVIKGKLHTDGGILNNLPVDVMRKFIGPKGIVIAVELTHLHEDDTHYHFPPILSFWQTLLAKLKITHRDYKFPHFVDTFLKSLLAGASAKQHENSAATDILISPNLSKFGILQVKKSQETELVRIGYTCALSAIQAWQAQQTRS